MILLCLFQESKNIIFPCGDSKNHSWPSPLVIFSVPTRENNIFTLLSPHSNTTLHGADWCTVCTRPRPLQTKMYLGTNNAVFQHILQSSTFLYRGRPGQVYIQTDSRALKGQNLLIAKLTKHVDTKVSFE
jgi:hypothetical protein